jgi:hypothetical protein
MPLALVLVAGLAGACSAGGPGTEVSERHELPQLPDLDSVLLPSGFETYELHHYEFGSSDPIAVDSGFFGYDRSHDFGGNESCPAQITVSPYDPSRDRPEEYVEQLGTNLCDAEWFVTADLADWRADPDDERFWFAETDYTEVGLFSAEDEPAFAMMLFDPERGVVVGLWARADVYRPDQAEQIVRDVAASVGR